jgi:hypothetical protein
LLQELKKLENDLLTENTQLQKDIEEKKKKGTDTSKEEEKSKEIYDDMVRIMSIYYTLNTDKFILQTGKKISPTNPF